MEKQLLEELREIKMLCIANFIELQEIRSKLNIAETDPKDRYAYADQLGGHMAVMQEKIRGLIKAYPHFQGDLAEKS
ncbi:hypothetical protein E8K88_02700 [Lampropedia aestuarii]|uniref:Uncharacterized protein n=1 Tax=Lampropedia aestuarii TaxID=2562762 RepID=A0A4S5BU28_9BURK|nr:hypothetical protein [Lampropedia aestuarii]THJ36190.1 hypothetical protein E8K88_02700 [Lampropedia aestuarii]